jgi:hypothetical protein
MDDNDHPDTPAEQPSLRQRLHAATGADEALAKPSDARRVHEERSRS